MSESMLYGITSTGNRGCKFTAGVVVIKGGVVKTAPILKWMRGWEWTEVSRKIQKYYGWAIEKVPTLEEEKWLDGLG